MSQGGHVQVTLPLGSALTMVGLYHGEWAGEPPEEAILLVWHDKTGTCIVLVVDLSRE